jgi:hypothetical protein
MKFNIIGARIAKTSCGDLGDVGTLADIMKGFLP